MLSSRNLRWANAGISNGRQRLSSFPANSRQYSLHTSPKHASHSINPITTLKYTRNGQSRSLSLFGWNASSNPSRESAVNPSSSAADTELGSSALSNVRTVKASHATSDFPDPSQIIPSINDNTPLPIERLSDSFALPENTSTFEEVTDNVPQAAVTPEYVGYLREVAGLDFGWGPSSVMQWVFEHIHMTGGYGWVGSIILLSSITRLAMVPAMVTAQKEGQKMKAIQPYLAPLRNKYQAHMATGDRAKAMEVGQEMRALNKEANIKYSRMFVPLLIQLPFQFGAFRMLRAAGDLPVPGFIDLPWLWSADLSLSDPYYLTPLISSGLIYLQFRQSQKQSALSAGSPVTPQTMKIIGRIIPGASFLFMIFQPGAVQLYFMISSMWAFGTTYGLRQTPIRAALGLNPLAAAENTILDPKPVVNNKPRGGLQSKPPQIVTTTARTVPEQSQQKTSTSDESFVDRGLDKVKSVFSKGAAASGFNAVKAKTDAAAQKKQQQIDNRRVASFEADRERRLAAEREERNRKQTA